MKKILSFIIVIFMFLLVGCGNRYEMLTNELNKIKEDPEYIFLGRAGITKNNVAYSFVEEIEKAVKESKRKLFSEAGYLDKYIYDNNRIYFLYKYYWSGDKEKILIKQLEIFALVILMFYNKS